EGLVTEVFSEKNRRKITRKLQGNLGIGHTLYSTVGRTGQRKQTRTFQPLIGKFQGEPFALAHNGNLIGLSGLRKKAKEAGYKFKSEVSDTEVIVALLSVSKKDNFIEALKEVLPKLKGAFALVILYKDKIIGVRDRHGIRPLCVGRNAESTIIA
ncbi:MAG: amidophosphoribosyltransferase, partial [Candidatus Nealsonbacteria bacterium]|nr:amidophosphoribosyltransferase [Candidatus Nealsonbacteria bacterium]